MIHSYTHKIDPQYIYYFHHIQYQIDVWYKDQDVSSILLLYFLNDLFLMLFLYNYNVIRFRFCSITKYITKYTINFKSH